MAATDMNATAVDTSTSGSDLPGVIDDRTPEVRRLDYATNLVIDLAAAVDKLIQNMPQGNTQRIIYKTEGMGTVGVVCATICAMCLLFLILGAILIVPEIHDLNAWKDIHQAKIAKLEAQQERR